MLKWSVVENSKLSVTLTYHVIDSLLFACVRVLLYCHFYSDIVVQTGLADIVIYLGYSLVQFMMISFKVFFCFFILCIQKEYGITYLVDQKTGPLISIACNFRSTDHICTILGTL